jgi:predicted acyltransferase
VNTDLAKPTRYYSLDVFRGATVAFMIVVNNPGSWSHLFSPLGHAKWHGLTPTDLVFPFFLFAVGNAMAFVIPRLRAEGDSIFWRKVITRTALIFLIGLFLNWFPFVRWQDGELVARGWTWLNPEGNLMGVRIPGVLQRIAFCYFFAAIIIYFTKPKGAVITSAILLVGYWALCLSGNPADPYTLEGWFGTAVDKAVFGEAHMYHGEGVAFEPEGLMSTIPAVVEVVLGYLFSYYLISGGKSETPSATYQKTESTIYKTLSLLFIGAALLLFAGYCWGLVFPINKKIWTSSYVLFTSGLATLILCTLIYFIEVKNYRGALASFFEVFGKNPLFIYALSGLIPRLSGLMRFGEYVNEAGEKSYQTPMSWYYDNIAANIPGPPEFGSLFYAISFMVLLWAIGYWMNKKKIYVRV